MQLFRCVTLRRNCQSRNIKGIRHSHAKGDVILVGGTVALLGENQHRTHEQVWKMRSLYQVFVTKVSEGNLDSPKNAIIY